MDLRRLYLSCQSLSSFTVGSDATKNCKRKVLHYKVICGGVCLSVCSHQFRMFGAEMFYASPCAHEDGSYINNLKISLLQFLLVYLYILYKRLG